VWKDLSILADLRLEGEGEQKKKWNVGPINKTHFSLLVVPFISCDGRLTLREGVYLLLIFYAVCVLGKWIPDSWRRNFVYLISRVTEENIVPFCPLYFNGRVLVASIEHHYRSHHGRQTGRKGSLGALKWSCMNILLVNEKLHEYVGSYWKITRWWSWRRVIWYLMLMLLLIETRLDGTILCGIFVVNSLDTGSHIACQAWLQEEHCWWYLCADRPSSRLGLASRMRKKLQQDVYHWSKLPRSELCWDSVQGCTCDGGVT